MSCCRFRGHENEIVTKDLESGYNEEKFSCEFKIEAVRLVTNRGLAVSQATGDLDLSENVARAAG